MCEEQKGNLYCVDCDQYLCNDCGKKHKKGRKTANDKVIQASEKESVISEPFCPDHSAQKLDIFCQSCNKPVCLACATLNHQGHSYQSTLQLGVTARSNIQNTINQVNLFVQSFEILVKLKPL